MNTFKHNELDTITPTTLFIDMPFYKWLAANNNANYLLNLSNDYLTSTYQYLETLGFDKENEKLNPVHGHYLKNCFSMFVSANIGVYKKPRLHELKNMLEHAHKDTQGALYLNGHGWLNSLENGWYVPTGALAATLENYPTVYGNAHKDFHTLNILHCSAGTGLYRFQLSFTRIIGTKELFKFNSN